MKKISKTARAHRAKFVKAYGQRTVTICRLVYQKGWNSEQISKKTGVPKASVAAVLANLTRGRYDKLLWDCRY